LQFVCILLFLIVLKKRNNAFDMQMTTVAHVIYGHFCTPRPGTYLS